MGTAASFVKPPQSSDKTNRQSLVDLTRILIADNPSARPESADRGRVLSPQATMLHPFWQPRGFWDGFFQTVMTRRMRRMAAYLQKGILQIFLIGKGDGMTARL